MDMASGSKRKHSAEVYSDDDYLPSSPRLEPFYPSWPQQEQTPDLDSDGDEDEINEPWAPGLRLRPQTRNTWREWLSSSVDWTDEDSKLGKASWKDQIVLGHMATCTHGLIAVEEAGWRGHSALDANYLDETVQPDRKRARVSVTEREGTILKPEQRFAASRRSDPRLPRRKVLPMVLKNDGQAFDMSACPDSGSDVNAMSCTAAQSLGCKIEPPEANIPEFHLANGRPTGAVGRVAVECSFSIGTPWHNSALSCVFHVFNTLAVPLIMGMQFLEKTETLSKYHDRLVEELIPTRQGIMVNSIGRPLKSLICQLDGCNGLAVADTGSDLDLISDNYAQSRGFTIEEAYHELILADGSLALTRGVTRVSFTIGHVNADGDFVSRCQAIKVDFYVLENLSSDILIGQNTVLDLKIFTDHVESLIPSVSHSEEPINIIRYKGKLEKAAAATWKKLRGVRADGDGTSSVSDAERDWELEDQRETYRREIRRAVISDLHGEERAHAEIEETRRIHQYELGKAKRKCNLLPSMDSVSEPPTLSSKGSLSGPKSPNVSSTGSQTPARIESPSDTTAPGDYSSYVCAHPGCTALPFQTQYLLDCHANVHNQFRPYLCPFPGCRRSEGSNGFKRKNEMTRHGLVHKSPGYVCPFCQDKRVECSRPDILMRHMRARHPEEFKNDFYLQGGLAQKTEWTKKRPEPA